MIMKLFRRLPAFRGQPSSLDSEEKTIVDELHRVQEGLIRSIDLANLHDDPLRFPLQAISDIAELQVKTHITSARMLRRVAYAAEQVNNPSESLKTQLVKSFKALAWEQRLRFAMMVGVLYAASTVIAGTLVAWAIIEAHRDTADAAALFAAAGNYPASWTLTMLRNDLPSMLTNCAKSQHIPAPNGRHYCSVWMIMDGVEAQPPPAMSWNEDTVSSQTR